MFTYPRVSPSPVVDRLFCPCLRLRRYLPAFLSPRHPSHRLRPARRRQRRPLPVALPLPRSVSACSATRTGRPN